MLFSLPLGQQSITNIILLLLFIHSLVFNRLPHWKAAFSHPLWWVTAAFYGYLLLSLFWSENHALAARQLETKASFILAPLFILTASPSWTKSARSFCLKAFWWGALVAMLVALAAAGLKSIEAGALYIDHEAGRRYFFTYTHLAGPLMHPGYLATFLGFAIFTAVELQAKASTMLWTWLYRLSIPCTLFFMLLLQARINLIALFVVIGLGALILVWKKRAFAWLGIALIPILFLSLFLAFASDELKERYLQFPDFSYDISGTEFNSATYRLAEWKCALEVIEANFWWGTGIGDNEEALLESYRSNKFWLGLEKRFNAHNQYLQTMIAGGLVGLVLMVLMLIYYAIHAYRRLDYLSLAGIIFLMICLSTESMFERMWGVLFFAMIFPLLAMSAKESDSGAY